MFASSTFNPGLGNNGTVDSLRARNQASRVILQGHAVPHAVYHYRQLVLFVVRSKLGNITEG